VLRVGVELGGRECVGVCVDGVGEASREVRAGKSDEGV
jgi:hypothetical protein